MDSLKVLPRDVRPIVQAVGYKGRTIRIEPAHSVTLFGRYWDGGTIHEYTRVGFDMSVKPYPRINPIVAAREEDSRKVELDKTAVVVCHTIFCGKDVGLCIYVHPDMMPKFLPAAAVAH